MKFRLVAAFALVLGLVACGGGDDGDGGGVIDAPSGAIDAPGGNIDAPMATGGLGQICNQQMACPSSAMLCLLFSSAPNANGYCSLVCASGQMNMPNAQGQFPRPPTSTDAACVSAFSGSAGTPICGVVLSNSLQPPVPAGQQPNPQTTYTYDAACIITCGAGNACPTGLTCQQGACLP